MSIDGLTDRQIEVAVEWWARVLENPKFQTLSPEERRDPASRGAAAAEMIATAFHESPLSEQLEKFKEELAKGLRNASKHERRWLSVDYGPCGLLGDAAERAGMVVGIQTFPWKTCMRLDDGRVSVSYGYRAEEETLYSPEEV